MDRQKINTPQYTHNFTWKLYRFLPLDFQKKRLLKKINSTSSQLLHFPLKQLEAQSVLIIISELPEDLGLFKNYLTKMCDQVSKLRVLCKASLSQQITGIPHSWIINYPEDQLLIGSTFWDELLHNLNQSDYQQILFVDKLIPFNLAYLAVSTNIPLRMSFTSPNESWMSNVILNSTGYQAYFSLYVCNPK